MDDKKKSYNILRAFLSAFGISYSDYIRQCDGILHLEETEESLIVYNKELQRMIQSDEGFLYWYIIKILWVKVTNSIYDSLDIKTKPIVLAMPSLLLFGENELIKDIDKTINLINKILDFGFSFTFDIKRRNEKYKEIVSHFKNHKNVNYII